MRIKFQRDVDKKFKISAQLFKRSREDILHQINMLQ